MLGLFRRSALLGPLLVVAAWLLAGCVSAPLVSGLGTVAGLEQSALLPRGAESTEVAQALEALEPSSPRGSSLPLVVVWTATRPGPGGRDGSDLQARAAAALSSLDGRGYTTGVPGRISVSQDGTAVAGVVQIRSGPGIPLGRALRAVRGAAAAVPRTEVELAGPAAVRSDLDGVFEGVDGRLLLVALVAVLLILVWVYRSPLLPLLVITTALLALAVACACLYGLACSRILLIDGQVQGILFVLVIGATTDYGLLLTARYREELDRDPTVSEAVRVAWRRSVGPLAASAATVALGLLTLLLSDLPAHRALGPAGAIAMAAALLCALTFLPAVLVLLGPAAFWPRRGTSGPGRGPLLWHRIAYAVARRPRRIWAGALTVIIAGVALSPLLTTRGVPLDRALPATAPSVAGQAALERRFPAGLGNPAVVLTAAARLDEVRAAAAGTPGVAGTEVLSQPDGRPVTRAGRAWIAVTLTHVADGEAAQRTVGDLRAAVRTIPGAHARVGGQAAQAYDMQASSAHDRSVIMPTVLVTVLLVLVVLLRCLLLPVLLVVIVVLTFLAALGTCAALLRFTQGAPDTEPTIVLYAFVFLVALGVDYNIFLMHRVREEALLHGTHIGVRRGLTSTGGVISSAGIVLAATFAALTVMPLVYLVHIGVIVAVGVLLDSLLVRLFLVPALVTDLGPATWWPRMLPADAAVALHRLIGPRTCSGPLPRSHTPGARDLVEGDRNGGITSG
ncbi:MMPL family transporter [Streptomyces sp. NPDC087917]|uniref:MMPL family transporter n=1 Tax=Streptomyces sp. NPDC087917 TaxID=3155060 RepID=UPI00343EEB85